MGGQRPGTVLMRPTEYAEYTYPDGVRVLLHEQDAIVDGFCLRCGVWQPEHTSTRTGLCPTCAASLIKEHKLDLAESNER